MSATAWGVSAAALAAGAFLLSAATSADLAGALQDGRAPSGSLVADALVAAVGGDDGRAAPVVVAEGAWLSGTALASLLVARNAARSGSDRARGLAWIAYAWAMAELVWAIGLVAVLHDGGCLGNGRPPWDCPWGD